MCAQFMLRAKLQDLAEFYSATLLPEYESFAPAELVLPHRISPVIIERAGARVIVPMRFSLIPGWSKESKIKFATHNARIDGLTTKATWRGPLKKTRCLVPLTDFIEPIYTGDYAGKMVRFHPRNNSILSAAGLYDSWKGENEEILSFAIITDEANSFISEIGHDRQPVFLEQSSWHDWIGPERSESSELLKILGTNTKELELSVEVDRAMKPGWEKRVKS